MLYHKFENSDLDQVRLQLVVPKSLREQVLHQLHDVLTSRHLGISKTLSKVRERFYWVNCHRDVDVWCLRCDACAKRKGPQRKNKTPLKKYVSGAPMERLTLDILGPLPVSDFGNKYLLIMGDYFSK